jgi:prepilin-type N-terminal cleavage/methylation domain-containing protein
MRTGRGGFSLLETLVALTLFAGVLLSVVGTGQFIMARMYDSDVRFRTTVFAQSLIDSLRGTACARLNSGSAVRAPLSAMWTVTDQLDLVRLDLTVSQPRRGGAAPRMQHTTALLPCPEP